MEFWSLKVGPEHRRPPPPLATPLLESKIQQRSRTTFCNVFQTNSPYFHRYLQKFINALFLLFHLTPFINNPIILPSVFYLFSKVRHKMIHAFISLKREERNRIPQRLVYRTFFIFSSVSPWNWMKICEVISQHFHQNFSPSYILPFIFNIMHIRWIYICVCWWRWKKEEEEEKLLLFIDWPTGLWPSFYVYTFMYECMHRGGKKAYRRNSFFIQCSPQTFRRTWYLISLLIAFQCNQLSK